MVGMAGALSCAGKPATCNRLPRAKKMLGMEPSYAGKLAACNRLPTCRAGNILACSHLPIAVHRKEKDGDWYIYL